MKLILYCIDSQNLMMQMRVLSIDETHKLLQSNKDYIKNLQLFENKGNFSKEEVSWFIKATD